MCNAYSDFVCSALSGDDGLHDQKVRGAVPKAGIALHTMRDALHLHPGTVAGQPEEHTILTLSRELTMGACRNVDQSLCAVLDRKGYLTIAILGSAKTPQASGLTHRGQNRVSTDYALTLVRPLLDLNAAPTRTQRGHGRRPG